MFLTDFVLVRQVRPGEPVYAQVNRDKKKNSRGPVHPQDPQQQQQMYQNYAEHADHWQVQNHQQQALDGSAGQQQQQPGAAAPGGTPAGDSWV